MNKLKCKALFTEKSEPQNYHMVAEAWEYSLCIKYKYIIFCHES